MRITNHLGRLETGDEKVPTEFQNILCVFQKRRLTEFGTLKLLNIWSGVLQLQ